MKYNQVIKSFKFKMKFLFNNLNLIFFKKKKNLIMEKERDIKKSKKVISKGLKRLDFKIFRIFLERLNNKLIENLKKFLYLTKKYFQKKFLIDLSKTIFFKLKKKALEKFFLNFQKINGMSLFKKGINFLKKVSTIKR